jgi:sugar phosphate isomerase/epimerase
MTRRELIAAAISAPALHAKNRIGIERISVLTDEVAKTPADAIAFAKQYNLRWVELREIPGKRGSYYRLPLSELKAAAKELADNQLKVSFLNTGMLKYTLPGTEPIRRRPETTEQKTVREANAEKQFAGRIEDLKRAIEAADVFGVDKVRIFTFLRVADPPSLFPRIVEIIGEMAQVAERGGVQLLIENEGSCNVGTSQELAEIVQKLPSKSVGINWDPLNGTGLKEKPFPDGYAVLPKKRLGNVQIKAKSILEGPQKLDWWGIFRALEKDGYKGQVGLETHVFDGTLIEAAHASMREVLRIVQVS